MSEYRVYLGPIRHRGWSQRGKGIHVITLIPRHKPQLCSSAFVSQTRAGVQRLGRGPGPHTRTMTRNKTAIVPYVWLFVVGQSPVTAGLAFCLYDCSVCDVQRRCSCSCRLWRCYAFTFMPFLKRKLKLYIAI